MVVFTCKVEIEFIIGLGAGRSKSIVLDLGNVIEVLCKLGEFHLIGDVGLKVCDCISVVQDKLGK